MGWLEMAVAEYYYLHSPILVLIKVLILNKRIVEGLMTIFVAILFLLFHPKSVRNPSPLLSFNRWSYFSQRQQHIMLSRLGISNARCDIPTDSSRRHVSWKELLDTFKNYRLWFHIALTMLSACALHGLTLYTPRMIKSFGFNTVHSNALSSVAYFGAITMTIALGHLRYDKLLMNRGNSPAFPSQG